MSLFKKSKKKSNYVLGSMAEGRCVEIREVNDPTFSEELLGKGIAILPTGNHITAPADGTVSSVFRTKHAVTLITDYGAEILIHIGLETVNLEGRHFKTYVNDGDTVKKGDLLVEFDREKMKEEGYDTIIPMVICNTAEFTNITTFTGKDIQIGETVITMDKD